MIRELRRRPNENGRMSDLIRSSTCALGGSEVAAFTVRNLVELVSVLHKDRTRKERDYS